MREEMIIFLENDAHFHYYYAASLLLIRLLARLEIVIIFWMTIKHNCQSEYEKDEDVTYHFLAICIRHKLV